MHKPFTPRKRPCFGPIVRLVVNGLLHYSTLDGLNEGGCVLIELPRGFLPRWKISRDIDSSMPKVPIVSLL